MPVAVNGYCSATSKDARLFYGSDTKKKSNTMISGFQFDDFIHPKEGTKQLDRRKSAPGKAGLVAAQENGQLSATISHSCVAQKAGTSLPAGTLFHYVSFWITSICRWSGTIMRY
ncbi:hypothetical protein Fot_19579 [Forsythia ovata]|uniref:Uncharacterized protein n=1 Tax=Forsythia ovata TaxID=205694 RepID=A0ABD1VNG7_9LAMI